MLVGDRRLLDIAHAEAGEAQRQAAVDQPGTWEQLIATQFVSPKSALKMQHLVRDYSGLRDRGGNLAGGRTMETSVLQTR